MGTAHAEEGTARGTFLKVVLCGYCSVEHGGMAAEMRLKR